jgi:hypothetical protein
MRAVSSTEAPVKAVKGEMGNVRVHDYFGRAGKIVEGPQGFLVEMLDPHAEIKPHFHDVDQFQVVVKGDGRLGRHPLQPIAFHYADGFSPYGPIIANKDGLSYFTLRPFCSSGYWGMPESRDKLREFVAKSGRNITAQFQAGTRRLSPGETARESFWERSADGMFASRLQLGARTSGAGAPSDGGGQYVLVCAGSLVQAGTKLPPMSLLYVEPGAAAQSFQAGDEGADLLVMQFPKPSDRPGSTPHAPDAKIEYKLPPGTTIE